MTEIVYRNDKHEFNLFFQTHNQQKIFIFHLWVGKLADSLCERNIWNFLFILSRYNQFWSSEFYLFFFFFSPPVFEHKQFILWCYIDFVNLSQWWECIRHFLLFFYIHVFPFLYVIYQLVSMFFNTGETLAKRNTSDISLTGTGMDM